MSESTAQAPAQTARDLLKALQQQFPVLRDYAPLAIGIDKQLLAQQPDINRKLLRSALGMHTKSVRYLKALQAATVRLNLDGSNADAVSDEQRELAANLLREYFKRRAEQHKAAAAAEAAKKAAEAAEQQRAEKLSKLQEKFSRK